MNPLDLLALTAICPNNPILNAIYSIPCAERQLAAYAGTYHTWVR